MTDKCVPYIPMPKGRGFTARLVKREIHLALLDEEEGHSRLLRDNDGEGLSCFEFVAKKLVFAP